MDDTESRELILDHSQSPYGDAAVDEVPAGFKRSAFGLIPIDWKSKSLGAVIDLLTGYPFSSSGFSDSGIRLIRGSNVKRGNLDWDEEITRHWPAISSDIAKYELRENDLIIAMDGALVGRSYSRVTVDDLQSLLVQRVARLRSSQVKQLLLFYWIASDFFVNHVDSVKTHTAIPHISPADIRDFAIVIPNDPDEQDLIAKALSDVDGLAIERAKLRGCEELLVGLNHHLAMHSRWAFGSGPLCVEAWPELPDPEAELSWRDVAVKLLGILLESYSAEVLGAALEGLHSLAAVDRSVIPQFFTTMTTAWQRRWLLIAAEAWAALYPEAVAEVADNLHQTMADGSLQERLQAWIILCKLSDVKDIPQPTFPFPDDVAGHSVIMHLDEAGLLHVPPTQYGSRRLTNRFSGIASKLYMLSECGWDFSTIEAIVRQEMTIQQKETDGQTAQKGPHRYGDFSCSLLDSENALSRAISSVLTSDMYDATRFVRFAQGLLDNEDAWIQMSPIRPATPTGLWPTDEYSDLGEMSTSDLKKRLIRITMDHDIPDGWKTFCAHVNFYALKHDFELR